MELNKLAVLIIGILLISVAFLAVGNRTAVSSGQNRIETLGNDGVIVTLVEDVQIEDVEVEEFTVNGETEEVGIGLDEEVEIHAEVSNNGDADVNMVVVVEEDGEEIETGNHLFEETVEAGDTVEINEEHDHFGWYEGEFTVRLVVEDDEVEEDEEVDWDEIRIVVGLVIAAFIVGIGVGVLWKKKA